MQDSTHAAVRGHDFLRDGGAMGERIRSHDWDASPLGAPAGWPLPLRTVVRILLTTNHPVFVFWGPHLTCLYNDAYSRSLGPEKHPAMLGAPGREAWDEIWPWIGPQIEQVMTGRGSTWHENHLVPITRHGRREDVYWTYSYSPIDDPSAPNGVGGVLVLCTETTEQVRAAERLRSAEGRWRQLFDQAPGFMCVLSGPEHVYPFGNPTYFQLIGRGDDVLGRTVAEVLPWTVEQGYIALLDGVYRSGRPHTAIAAPMTLPGEAGQPSAQHFLDFVYQPIRDDNGHVNGIFVLGSEVTERVRAEAALRHSEQRLQIACEAAELGIHDHDLPTGTVAWDARMRALWGLADDATVDEGSFLAGIHPADRETVHTLVAQTVLAPGSGERRYRTDFRLLPRPGSAAVRWVQATGQASFERGRATRLVGTALDISERKQAEARRNEFLATLGHELRNPLAPIGNLLQVLKRQPQVDARARQAHEVIERQLAQMVRLLEDLLDVARIAHGRIELRRELVALDEVLRLALETALPHAERGQHAVDLVLPAQPVRVWADAVRLAQVFSNLIINACKYSEAGRPIRVTLGAAPAGEVAVHVLDEGIGIAPQVLGRVFDMFSQAQPSLERSQGGLGIGLALARGVVELHGGSISAHSAGLGLGSEFVVRLPTPAAQASGGDDDAAAAAQAQPEARPRGRRVLVVDDNVDAAESLALLLELHGAIVATAGDGVQALARAEDFRPQVVLLDIGLPGMNGYAVCRALRQRPWAAGVRIVALTGWGQDSDRAESQNAGFDAHLVKPVDHEALMREML